MKPEKTNKRKDKERTRRKNQPFLRGGGPRLLRPASFLHPHPPVPPGSRQNYKLATWVSLGKDSTARVALFSLNKMPIAGARGTSTHMPSWRFSTAPSSAPPGLESKQKGDGMRITGEQQSHRGICMYPFRRTAGYKKGILFCKAAADAAPQCSSLAIQSLDGTADL